MIVRAHAKLNLALRITGRRPDGYHELDTLMVPVSLADELEVEPAPGGIALECDDPSLPTDSTNLAARAAAAYLAASGMRGGVRLRLRKHIPHGAGLGGGSSDAAAVLRALDALNPSPLGPDRLERVAASFGSDTAFFVRSMPARCTGRGEILGPTDFPWSLPVVLIKPPFGVPTPWAYGAWKAMGDPRGEPGPAQAWGVPANDLEPPVFAKFLLLPTIKSWLAAQPGIAWAMMSGSGSTVFGVARDDEAAADAARLAPAEFGPHTFAWNGRAGRISDLP